jgi:Zn-dependent protease
METEEIKQLVISALVLAFVFGFAYSGGFGNLSGLVIYFPVSLFVVSLGFVLHELGHRTVAKRFDYHAEYRLWKEGLLLAVILTLVTNGSFIFAAPGAVMIYPKADLWGRVASVTRKSMGLISIAGPVMNILLATVFIILNSVFPWDVFSLGVFINIWLALFNMIPFPPFDGSKIFAWDKRIWTAMFIISGALFLTILL